MTASRRSIRALLVGGTGFIGLNLALALRDAGHLPLIARRRSSNTLPARALGLPLIHLEPDDPEAMVAAFREVDVVFMLAGHYPRVSVARDAEIAIGLGALRPVLDAARVAGPRVVFTSSIATAMPGDSTYHAVKRALEARVFASAAAGLDAIIVRPGGCIGPWDWKPGLGHVVLAALADRLPPWANGLVHLVSVVDVARGHIRAAEDGLAGRAYPLVDPSGPIAYATLLAMLARATGARVPPPSSLATVQALADAEERLWLATRRGRPRVARELVDLVATGASLVGDDVVPGWSASLGHPLTPLATALEDAVAWYRAHGYAPAPDSNRQPGVSS